jgi:hypothetical protein
VTCTWIKVPGGMAIVCDRGRKPRAKCTACKDRPHTKLCDFPLTGDRAGKTCSVRLCDRCAVEAGPDLDYCPPHAKVAQTSPRAEVRQWVRGELERAVREWCEDRFVDVEDVIDYWTERASIRCFEGGTPKWAAEELAFADVRERFGP